MWVIPFERNGDTLHVRAENFTLSTAAKKLFDPTFLFRSQCLDDLIRPQNLIHNSLELKSFQITVGCPNGPGRREGSRYPFAKPKFDRTKDTLQFGFYHPSKPLFRKHKGRCFQLYNQGIQDMYLQI
jgi:hypothetical protein